MIFVRAVPKPIPEERPDGISFRVVVYLSVHFTDSVNLSATAWSGRSASPGVDEPYTGVSRQSLPKDATTASLSAKEFSETDHRPEAKTASLTPTLDGLENQTCPVEMTG